MDPDRRDWTTFDVHSSLLARRVIVVTGEIDAPRASELTATLLALDASGDEHIDLRLNSCRGSFDAALAVIDVLGVIGVPVHGWALGTLEGGPVGVFASTERRRIAPHAALQLREPDVDIVGSAIDVQRSLAAHAARRASFFEAVARRVGRQFAEIEAEWGRSAHLEASDALTLGYADVIDAGSDLND